MARRSISGGGGGGGEGAADGGEGAADGGEGAADDGAEAAADGGELMADCASKRILVLPRSSTTAEQQFFAFFLFRPSQAGLSAGYKQPISSEGYLL